MKLITIVGARPQFIKAAPLSWAIRSHNASAAPTNTIHEQLCHTGQHYDALLSDVFFSELDIDKPTYQLGIGSASHAEQTAHMLEAVERTLISDRPDRVVVYGDTNSTLAGALAAGKLGVPVAHVEAGLRSFDRSMPEEINRILSDRLSDLLFAPTSTAVANLHREGMRKGVHRVGDVMFDLAKALGARCTGVGTSALQLQPGAYLLASVHRPSNADSKTALQGILDAFEQIGEVIVFPLHPRTRKNLERFDLPLPTNVRVCPPQGYLATMDLLARAKLALTDSGGLQKEAYFHGVPCVTLRDNTEWVETVDAGWNLLAGSDPQRIVAATKRFLDHSPPEPSADHPYGDGDAAQQIVKHLLRAA